MDKAQRMQGMELGYLIVRTGRIFTKYSGRAFKNISVNEEMTLYIIHYTGPILLSDLCYHLVAEPNTISILTKKLESKGLIEKYKDPNSRNVMIKLTDDAIEKGPWNPSAGDVISDEIINSISKSEAKQLSSILTKIYEKTKGHLDSSYKSPFTLKREK